MVFGIIVAVPIAAAYTVRDLRIALDRTKVTTRRQLTVLSGARPARSTIPAMRSRAKLMLPLLIKAEVRSPIG
jgi:hypothetical protein